MLGGNDGEYGKGILGGTGDGDIGGYDGGHFGGSDGGREGGAGGYGFVYAVTFSLYICSGNPFLK